jgi:predicted O-methyltransferase YrrM
MLEVLYPNQPILDVPYAILSAPVRHVFMIGAVWYVQRAQPTQHPQILEVGSWYGASALSFAQGVRLYAGARGGLTCVDAWAPFFDMQKHAGAEHAIFMENALATDTAYQIFLHNINLLPPGIACQHIRGQSHQVLPLLARAHFDIVFLDADHTYEAVKREIALARDLVKPGGLLCGDDLNLQNTECDLAFARDHLDVDVVRDPRTGRNFHPGVTLAVAELLGPVSAWGGFWALEKTADGWRRPSFRDMPVVFPEHFPPDAIAKARDHLQDIRIV